MIHNEILVVKLNSDSFESYISEGLSRYCDILDIGQFYNANVGFFFRNVSILKNALLLNKKGLFSEYKKIIVFDHFEIFTAITLMTLKSKKTKVYLWLWNTLTAKREKKLKIIKKFGRVYTFDEGDAKKNAINWNSQFYYLKNDHNKQYEEYCLYFVGKDKGRKEIVERVADILCDETLRPCIHLFDDKSAEFLDYKKVISGIVRSRAVLDITKIGQEGLTIRTMEALFFGKKLITNNKNIVNSIMYNPENIFILNQDNVSKIPEFLKGEPRIYSQNAKDYYSIENWLKRFED